MLAAVLSDIHSNPGALAAVLEDVDRSGAAEIWLLGDTFGYHPWAARTFELVAPFVDLAILGNHDRWVLDPSSAPSPLLGRIAAENAADLSSAAAGGLRWLARLPLRLTIRRRGWTITLAHGTPSAPLEGRLYPDDTEQHPWLPGPGELVLLGQTHHPINRGDGATGLLLNPGSVGQPRDGMRAPSWALLDLDTGAAELRRTSYDLAATVSALRACDWDPAVIAALERTPAQTPTGA